MLKCSTLLCSSARVAVRTAAATSASKYTAALAGYPSRSAHSFHTSTPAASLSTPTETLDIRQTHRHQQQQQQEQHTNLPTVQITKDSTSVLVTSPRESKYYRPERPTASLNSLWLRDNCPCSKCIDPTTRQKLHASSQVPADISVSSVQIYPDGLELTWSKGLLVDVEGGAVVVGQRDEELAKSRPGHKSLYPWEMILGSRAGAASECTTHEARANDKQTTSDL
ncbi:hypothetical protein KVV02_005970 [Mortierella alpina]|uniref:Gamma-butyrobetaine hydroxylase-like N-terminal domain-containing protein n=1 Tax=Mortierella alpina TaxID=64518 RepID=A0A9P8IEQ6_MORAP|nr:hypothetical protein KVV02_005970 [Mortierella alpina]